MDSSPLRGHLFSLQRPVQHLHDFRPRDGSIWTKVRRVGASYDTMAVAPTRGIVVPSRLRDVHERKRAASSVIFRSPVANNAGVSEFIHFLSNRVVGVALDGVHVSIVHRDYEAGVPNVLARAKEDLVAGLRVGSVPGMGGFVVFYRVGAACPIGASVVEDFLGVSGLVSTGFVNAPGEKDCTPIVAILWPLEEMRVGIPEVAGVLSPVARSGVGGFRVEVCVGGLFQVTNFLGGDADNIVDEDFHIDPPLVARNCEYKIESAETLGKFKLRYAGILLDFEKTIV